MEEKCSGLRFVGRRKLLVIAEKRFQEDLSQLVLEDH